MPTMPRLSMRNSEKNTNLSLCFLPSIFPLPAMRFAPCYSNPQLIHTFATSFFPIFQILGISVLITQSCFFPPSHLPTFSSSHLLSFPPSAFRLPTSFFPPSAFRLPTSFFPPSSHSDFRLPALTRLTSLLRIALIPLKTYDWLWGADSLSVD